MVSTKDQLKFVSCCATVLGFTVILSFEHKGLQNFYLTGSKAGIQGKHSKRLRFMLTALDTAFTIEDMNIPGFNLHPLSGNRKNFWSISVSGNWRLTFKFEDGNVFILNYEDYHR